jgi:hypothetical protein
MLGYASGFDNRGSPSGRSSPKPAASLRDGICAMAATMASMYGNFPGVSMRHTRLLCVLGVSLWSAVVGGSQATASVALSGTLRAHIQDGQFGIVTSIRGLPLGVREGLQALFGSPTLDIAEPGAEFQGTDVAVNPQLPSRRLVAASCSTDHYCLVYYERSGVAHTWHVALFHWTPAATRFEWGGTAPGSLRTIDDVRNAILSGVIKGQAGPW